MQKSHLLFELTCNKDAKKRKNAASVEKKSFPVGINRKSRQVQANSYFPSLLMLKLSYLCKA
jgi:hypothetical protein